MGVHNPHQNMIRFFPANTWWTTFDGIMKETREGGGPSLFTMYYVCAAQPLTNFNPLISPLPFFCQVNFTDPIFWDFSPLPFFNHYHFFRDKFYRPCILSCTAPVFHEKFYRSHILSNFTAPTFRGPAAHTYPTWDWVPPRGIATWDEESSNLEHGLSWTKMLNWLHINSMSPSALKISDRSWSSLPQLKP